VTRGTAAPSGRCYQLPFGGRGTYVMLIKSVSLARERIYPLALLFAGLMLAASSIGVLGYALLVLTGH